MDFLDMMESYNLLQLVKSPTHVKGIIIDLVFTRSNDSTIKKLWVENSHLSDHYSVIFSLETIKPKREQKTIEFRDLKKKINLDQLKNDIKEKDINSLVENEGSVTDKLNAFNQSLLEILNVHAPLKTKQIVMRPNTQWFTKEISELKRKTRKAESVWRKTKLHIHKELYDKAKLETNMAIKMAKQAHVNEALNKSKGDSKELFRIMNGLVKHESSKPPLPEHSDEKILAERFNTYFKQKIEMIRVGIDSNITTVQHKFQNPEPPCRSLASFPPATAKEITDILINAPNKTCGLDVIPTQVLKSCIEEVSPAITSIVNQSICNADFPSILKDAYLTPLLKKTNLDTELLKNYRPISNLNFISKVIEKVIARRLNDHLTRNNLHTVFQSAYKEGHSTETALLRVFTDIIEYLDNNDSVALLLLDLSAAFDTVDHTILLERLQTSFGIRDSALYWFSNYLHHRTQRVVINGCASNKTELDFGVPQGSVLGPLLFTLYTSPLSQLIKTHTINYHLYADDTQIYRPISNEDKEAANSNIMDCVSQIGSWMLDNKLKLNNEKTELINFTKKGKDQVLNEILIDNTKINHSTNVRNLGFVFDEHLTMNHHISKLCQNLHYILMNIGRIRHLLDQEACKLLVHALITSRLDYCNSLLYGLPKNTIKRLQLFQNKAARIITKTKKRDHISPVLKYLHWLPVERRIIYKIACIVFKCLKDLNAPSYLKSLINVHHPIRPLRSSISLSLKCGISKTRLSERAFSYSAPKVWNSLSDHTRNCQTFSSFRTALKTELFLSAFH